MKRVIISYLFILSIFANNMSANSVGFDTNITTTEYNATSGIDYNPLMGQTLYHLSVSTVDNSVHMQKVYLGNSSTGIQWYDYNTSTGTWDTTPFFSSSSLSMNFNTYELTAIASNGSTTKIKYLGNETPSNVDLTSAGGNAYKFIWSSDNIDSSVNGFDTNGTFETYLFDETAKNFLSTNILDILSIPNLNVSVNYVGFDTNITTTEYNATSGIDYNPLMGQTLYHLSVSTVDNSVHMQKVYLGNSSTGIQWYDYNTSTGTWDTTPFFSSSSLSMNFNTYELTATTHDGSTTNVKYLGSASFTDVNNSVMDGSVYSFMWKSDMSDNTVPGFNTNGTFLTFLFDEAAKNYFVNNIFNKKRYFEISENITLTEYESKTSNATLPADFYWLDSHYEYDGILNIYAGKIYVSPFGKAKETEKKFKVFDSNISLYETLYHDDNFTVDTNNKMIIDEFEEIKVVEELDNAQLNTLYSSYNMDVNFSERAKGYKIYFKNLKDELEVYSMIYNDYDQYTSLNDFIGDHNGSMDTKWLMPNDINQSKALIFDANISGGKLYEINVFTHQVINYDAGYWTRSSESRPLVYDYNSTLELNGTTSDMVVLYPDVSGYVRHDNAFAVTSDVNSTQAVYRGEFNEANTSTSEIALNSYAVNELFKIITGDTDAQVFNNTLKVDDLIWKDIKIDNEILDSGYVDNNVSLNETNSGIMLTAHFKDNNDSRAEILTKLNFPTLKVTADVNLSEASTSYNKGMMLAIFNDMNITDDSGNIIAESATLSASINVKGKGLFNWINIFDQAGAKIWSFDSIDYNNTMYYNPTSMEMINKALKLEISLNGNNISFSAYDESGNIFGEQRSYENNSTINLGSIDAVKFQARVDDETAYSESSTAGSLTVFNVSNIDVNNSIIFNTELTDISLLENNQASLDLNLSSIDSNVTYSVGSSDTSVVTVSILGNTLLISSTGSGGSAVIDLNVTVLGVITTKSFTVSIIDINDAPQILTTLNDLNLSEDFGSYVVDFNVTDIDGDDLNISVEYNSSIVDINGSFLNSYINQSEYNNLELNITSLLNIYGSTTVTLLVNDGELVDSQTFDINISSVADLNETMDEITLDSGWTFISLPATNTICDTTIQSVLATICDQNSSLDSLFGSNSHVKYMFKYTDQWVYWDKNDSINSNYQFDKFTTLSNKEGVAIKTDAATKIYVPKNIDNNTSEFVTLDRDGWFLTGVNGTKTVLEIKTLIESQGKALQYMWVYRTDGWHLYTPLSIAVGGTYSTITSIDADEGFWIYVK